MTKRKAVKKKAEIPNSMDGIELQEIIDHMDMVLNDYGMAFLNAAATVGTSRAGMITRVRAQHSENAAEFVRDLDVIIRKFAKEHNGAGFDILAALVYYSLLIHAQLISVDPQYKKVADAAQAVMEQLFKLKPNGGKEEDEYECEEDFVDPSVR